MVLELFEKIKQYNKSFDEGRVGKAFDFAIDRYKDTDVDVSELMSVIDVLMPLKPDEDTIIAILVHELYMLGFLTDERVQELFGQPVLNILLFLKRLLELNYAENDKKSQIEVFRKMFLTMAKDLRVILIWLAKRLCKMRDMDNLKDESRKSHISRETMDLYVPIASRLGIYRMKVQLEDYAFKYLHPKEYEDIDRQIEKFGELRRGAVDEICDKIVDYLRDKGVSAQVSGRVKSAYSIYMKLKQKGLSTLDDIFDFFAVRIVLPVKKDEDGNPTYDHLYSALGLLHSEWKPLSNRFKDYVAVPKPNGYRSLHTVIVGVSPKNINRLVEVQIRDVDMHREAEYGVASHWVYKKVGSVDNSRIGSQAEWIKGLQHVNEFFGSDSEAEILKEVEVDVFRDRIFVLTPRGEVKDLSQGANPIDFAYAVHTDVGNRCVMAKVNGSLVPLDYELENGDVVEIITKKDAVPKLRWLSIVKSSFAKNRIKAWFGSLNRENNIKEGKKILNAQLERLQKPALDQSYSILKNFGDKNLTLVQREALVEGVGNGSGIANDIVRKIYPYEMNLATKKIVSDVVVQDKNVVLEDNVVVGGEGGLPVKMASCCSPGFKDKIIGYVTRVGKISIHKSSCSLLDSLNGERIIFADWKGKKSTNAESLYRVGIKLTVVSRVGLIHDVTSIMTDMGINIADVAMKKDSSGLNNDCFLLDLVDLDQFDVLMDKLEQVSGVVKVVRQDKF
jgi:GTP pyrophosphokinase